jgi:membrane protease YdiL (CAAX protease family)
MKFSDDQENLRQPRLYGTVMVLLSLLVVYPLAGALLTMLATGGNSIDSDFRMINDSLLPRLLAAQAFGQMLILALPVFFLAPKYSGDGMFSRGNFAWLGIGKRGGVRPAIIAGAGMLLLQPALYSIVESQNLLLPYLGAVGKSLIQEQATLDLFIRKLAGSASTGGVLLSVLALAVTPAICEELFFRGYIQKSFALNLSPRKAILISGIVFALFHMEWFNFVPLTLLGWYIGYIYVKSDNLLVPAVAHGTNNLTALLLLKTGVSSGSAGDEASGILVSWQWWVLVAVSLILFSLLIRNFSGKPAFPDADNPMPGGHR